MWKDEVYERSEDSLWQEVSPLTWIDRKTHAVGFHLSWIIERQKSGMIINNKCKWRWKHEWRYSNKLRNNSLRDSIASRRHGIVVNAEFHLRASALQWWFGTGTDSQMLWHTCYICLSDMQGVYLFWSVEQWKWRVREESQEEQWKWRVREESQEEQWKRG